MKFILLLVVLFFACGAAVTLMVRLKNLTEQIANLHDQLRHNDKRLVEHRQQLERLAAEEDAKRR